MSSRRDVAEKLQAADIETLFIVANQFSLASRLRLLLSITVTAAAGVAGLIAGALWRTDIELVALAVIFVCSALVAVVMVSWRRSFLKEFNALLDSLPRPLARRDREEEILRTELIDRILRYREVARAS